MAGFLSLVIAISLLCVVQSQLLLPGPALASDVNIFEICGPFASSITIIDPLSLGVPNGLHSTILSNILDSSISFPSDSYDNIEFIVPCTFVVESVTYSPLIDVFYPPDYLPIFDMYPAPFVDLPQSVFITEAYPKVFYTETLTSFAPTTLSPMSSIDTIELSEFYAPNLQVVPAPYVNGFDIIPINSIPSNSVGLIDLIMPPHVFGGFDDLYFSGMPSYFDYIHCF